MYRVSNVKVREDIDDDEVIKFVCKKYKVEADNIISWNIYKKSIDARDKNDVHYNYTVDIDCKKKIRDAEEIKTEEASIKIEKKSNIEKSPIIVGAGPAGLFAARTFVKNGVKPIVIEQGKSIKERENDVNEFLSFRKTKYFV